MFNNKKRWDNEQPEIEFPSLDILKDCLCFMFCIQVKKNKQFLSCYKQALESQLKMVGQELKTLD